MLKVYYSKSANRNICVVNGKSMPYARYVAKNNPAICGDWFEGCEVHHINFNPSDDRAENLIVISKQEHHKIHSKPVDVFYKNKYIGRYISIKEAAKDNNIHPSVISHYCKHQTPISELYKDWRFSIVNPQIG